MELDNAITCLLCPAGVFFHVVGECTVKVGDSQNKKHIDKENYIDFRMRLLGEQGEIVHSKPGSYFPFTR